MENQDLATPGEADREEKDFETQVFVALKESNRNSDGKLEFKPEVSEEIRFAAISEQRRRDTQSEYTKSRQSQLALKAENKELRKLVNNSVKANLTTEQEQELEELKYSEPEKWFDKLSAYNNEAKSKYAEELESKLGDISAKEAETVEIEARERILAEYSANNPGFVLNDDVLENEIPPRITKQLKNNEISFPDFLVKVHDYMKAGKVVSTVETTLNQPNLSKAGGGDVPSDEAIKFEDNESYLTEIF